MVLRLQGKESGFLNSAAQFLDTFPAQGRRISMKSRRLVQEALGISRSNSIGPYSPKAQT